MISSGIKMLEITLLATRHITIPIEKSKVYGISVETEVNKREHSIMWLYEVYL